MKKGIVMEIQSDILIMMTPEGEFIKARKQPSVQYEIGEEHVFFPLTQRENPPSLLRQLKRKLNVKPVLSGAAALLMLMLILFPAFNSPEVYAYVSVDINPSFEMSVDKNNEVLEIDPFNKEAEEILQQLEDWEGMTVTAVTDDIIELSEDKGYLDSEGIVTLTTVFTEKAEDTDKKALREAVEKLSAKKLENRNAEISIIASNTEVRAEAQKAGMTAGKFLIQKKEKKQEQPSKEEEQKEPSQASAPANGKADTDSKALPAAAKEKDNNGKQNSNAQSGNGTNPPAKNFNNGRGKNAQGVEKKQDNPNKKDEKNDKKNNEKNNGRGHSYGHEKQKGNSNSNKEDRKDEKREAKELKKEDKRNNNSSRNN